jgi:hypothetical protein
MELTYEVAKTTLLKLAEERPEYVHTLDPRLPAARVFHDTEQTCLYRLADGSPGCIVGALAAELFPGVVLQEGSVAHAALERVGISLDYKTRSLVSYVQCEQDAGIPWGEAVPIALRTVESEWRS